MIARQRGILFEITEDRLEALLQFMRAMYFDKDITISEREHKGPVVRLFKCARQLSDAGTNPARLKANHGKTFSVPGWVCPVPGSQPAATSAVPTLTAPPPPAPEVAGATDFEDDAPEATIWSQPWLWIVVGVVVVAGAATATGIAVGSGGSYGGSADVLLRLPGE